MNGESYRLAHSRARKADCPPSKIVNGAGTELWSGYALPTFRTGVANWQTFAPPRGKFLRRR